MSPNFFTSFAEQVVTFGNKLDVTEFLQPIRHDDLTRNDPCHLVSVSIGIAERFQQGNVAAALGVNRQTIFKMMPDAVFHAGVVREFRRMKFGITAP